jgi:hypothetical protein
MLSGAPGGTKEPRNARKLVARTAEPKNRKTPVCQGLSTAFCSVPAGGFEDTPEEEWAIQDSNL